MKMLQCIMAAVFLVTLAGGCKQMEAWDRHNMDPMGESVRQASNMQQMEYPPCAGPEVMDGQKQAKINTNYVKDNAKGLPKKASTTSTDVFTMSNTQ
ncbi:hypothetical protein ACAG65_11710 [Halodesulfovibrio aestuarii]|uniref:hypothetical protein n=1 Tax=Halodesulfovibrio aestuarii TaxID=126333 RepID=UPI0035201471